PAGAVPSTAADAVRTGLSAIMQVGFRLCSFTQDDYCRMCRIHPEKFPEKGYGRTRDILFNWFYGFGTDRNTPPPPEGTLERTGKNLVPGIVQDVLDTRAGTKLALDDGRAPAKGTETLDQVRTNPNLDLVGQVDAGPARD